MDERYVRKELGDGMQYLRTEAQGAAGWRVAFDILELCSGVGR